MSDSGFQVADAASEAYDRHVEVFMAPLAEALLDRAGVGRGDAVLDLACGTGFVARRAVDLVGSEGHVSGADINPGMLEVARRRAPTAPPEIAWHHASASALPFDDGTFTRVVVQQGIQFFPDLDLAVREMARVTAPGGTVAATSWTPMGTSPYFQAQHTALSETFGTEALASFAAAFRLDEDRLRAAWEGAGLRDVVVTSHAPEVTLPPLTPWFGQHLAATPWGPLFETAEPEARARVVERTAEMLTPWTRDGAATVPFGTFVVTGVR